MENVYVIVRIFTLFRPDISYTKYFIYISAIFVLINRNYYNAFICLTNFLIPSCFLEFIQNNKLYIKSRIALMDSFLGEKCPALMQHFDKIELPTNFYLAKWFESAFFK